jgi:MoxR-like ATPase
MGLKLKTDLQEELRKLFSNTPPDNFVISESKWKYFLRSIWMGENILLVGPTGCGKTQLAILAAKILSKYRDTDINIFNCGGAQDPRATLIGNTSFKKEHGTFFHVSPFIKAVQTPNSIIVLDEITRGNHDLWNILMPVLDINQRTLRLDEQIDSPVIPVAENVCFIATANIGMEYTATRVLDAAIMNRFLCKIEMPPIKGKDLYNYMLSTKKYSKDTVEDIKVLSKIYDSIKKEAEREDGKISTILSPRQIIYMANLVNDGFSMDDIYELCILPEYEEGNSPDSERTFIAQLLQQYVSSNINNPVKV